MKYKLLHLNYFTFHLWHFKMLAVKTNKPFNPSEEIQTRIREVMELYPEGKSKSALLPVLHIVQDENEGWLSVEAMDKVAE